MNSDPLVDEALSIASYALGTSVHKTLGVSPGSAVFNRDMILDPLLLSFILL